MKREFMRFCLSLALLLFAGLSASAQEPYAVLSSDNTTLTFYYDSNKEARGGMSVGPFESSSSWYGQRESITSVVFDDSFAACTSITSTAQWFSGFKNLTSITSLEKLNTANVTDMRSMFQRCSSLTSLNVSSFNIANVTRMGNMFYGCSGLTSLDLSSFSISLLTALVNDRTDILKQFLLVLFLLYNYIFVLFHK